MPEGPKEEFVHKVWLVGESRPSKKELTSQQKMMIAVSAFGVGTAGVLFSGLLDKSNASNEPNFTTGQANEQSKLNREHILGKSPMNEVFGNGVASIYARSTVDEMNDVIRRNSSFGDMLRVVRKNEDILRESARNYGISEDIFMGIALIENGGGDDKTSPAGARGILQAMEKTARRYGLRVDDEVDERADVQKLAPAMAHYLSDMKEAFGGNFGIAVWGYHAGEGNVYSALREYFKDKKGVDYGDIGVALDKPDLYQKITSDYSKAIKAANLNLHELLNNPSVKENVLLYLGDETELYAYKAVAGAEIRAEEAAKSSLD